MTPEQSNTPIALRLCRLLFAVLGVVALAWIPIREIDSGAFSVANYFSYFTILSNVLAVITLAVGALVDPQSRGWQLFRGATTVYMVVTCIIYAVLLAGIDVNLNDDWINNSLHRILPLAILVDWLLSPPRMRISDKASAAYLAFPVVYGVYSLVRGAIVDWYPYPFLDPREQGYLQLAIGLATLLVAMALISLAVNVFGRKAGDWRYGGAERLTVPRSESEVEA